MEEVRTYDEPVAWVRRVAWNLATSRFRRQKTATNFLRRLSDSTKGSV
jgi:RNA polymerase sigma-70 factor, ECF subfamily